MTDTRETCLNCGVEIVDPTTRVVHGREAFCCPNCSEAFEQRAGGSDPRAPQHRNAIHCAFCDVPIVDDTTMEMSEGKVYCCPNCARAAKTRQSRQTR